MLAAYDDSRRQVETTLSLYGLRVSAKLRTLNEHGLVERERVEMTLHGRTRDVLYTYTYNDRGDWIERAAYVDGALTPATLTRREIDYAPDAKSQSLKGSKSQRR